MIDPTGIIIDAKSGISGAGRTPKLSNLFSECNESVTAYSIWQTSPYAGDRTGAGRCRRSDVQVAFNPHLMPMDRGIFCSIYPRLIAERSQSELLEIFRSSTQVSRLFESSTTSRRRRTSRSPTSAISPSASTQTACRLRSNRQPDQRRKRRCYSEYEPDARIGSAHGNAERSLIDRI